MSRARSVRSRMRRRSLAEGCDGRHYGGCRIECRADRRSARSWPTGCYRVGAPPTAWAVRYTPSVNTRTAAASGTYVGHATDGRCRADAFQPAAGKTIARPIPAMTAAMPTPNATTRTKPNAGRPAAIEPSRISRALVDGIRPPARPRTNRLRHVIVEPAGGRWLWRTPPWLCSPARPRGARWCVWAGSWSWSCSCGCRGRSWSCSCRASCVRGRRPPSPPRRAPPAPQLAEQHPAADDDDRDRRHDRRRANDQVRREHPLRPDDQRGQHQDPDRVRHAHGQPEAERVQRPARACRRGTPPSASCRAPASGHAPRQGPPPSASDTSRTTGVRSAERKIDGRSRAPHAARDAGPPDRSRDGAADRAWRRQFAGTSIPAPSIGLASAMSNAGSVGPPSAATTDIEVCANGRVSMSAG